jgi:hypothetical protein
MDYHQEKGQLRNVEVEDSKEQRGPDDPIDEMPPPPPSAVRAASQEVIAPPTQTDSVSATQRISTGATPSIQEPEASVATTSPAVEYAPRRTTTTTSTSTSSGLSAEDDDQRIKKQAAKGQTVSRPIGSQEAFSKTPHHSEETHFSTKISDESLARAKGAERAERKAVRQQQPVRPLLVAADDDDDSSDPRRGRRLERNAARKPSRSPVRPATALPASKRAERAERRAVRKSSRSPIRSAFPPKSVAVGVPKTMEEDSENNSEEEDDDHDGFEFQPGAIRVGASLSDGVDDSMAFEKVQEDSTSSKKIEATSLTGAKIAMEDSLTGERISETSIEDHYHEKAPKLVPVSVKDLESQDIAPVVAHLAPDEDELAKQLSERVEAEVTRRLQEQNQKPLEGAVAQAIIVENENENDDTSCCWSKRGICLLILVGVVIIVVLSVTLGGSSDSTSPPISPPFTLAPTPAPTPVPAAAPTEIQFSLRFEALYEIIGSKVSETPETTLRDTETVQNWAMSWMADADTAGIDFETEPKQALIERYALTVIYGSTGGDTWWTSSRNFLSPQPACAWNDAEEDSSQNGAGAFCSNSTMVTTLTLRKSKRGERDTITRICD